VPPTVIVSVDPEDLAVNSRDCSFPTGKRWQTVIFRGCPMPLEELFHREGEVVKTTLQHHGYRLRLISSRHLLAL
jgi:hypothetical protein